MAFNTLRKLFTSQLVGVQEERVAVRTQGCWSCIHADYDKAIKRWWEGARAKLLARAVQISLESPAGEEDQRVRNLRSTVPQLDHGMESRQWIACEVGKKADGSPVGDFVHQSYLCGGWTARMGASVARAGKAPDKLPEELQERLDGGEEID